MLYCCRAQTDPCGPRTCGWSFTTRNFKIFMVHNYHGAVISVKFVDVNRRKSPLVQGGLEIPVKVIVAMPFSTDNKQALDKYNILVSDHYEEPADGNFKDAITSILSDSEGDSDTDESETDKEEA